MSNPEVIENSSAAKQDTSGKTLIQVLFFTEPMHHPGLRHNHRRVTDIKLKGFVGTAD